MTLFELSAQYRSGAEAISQRIRLLRQRLKPEELIGTLAFAAGLTEKNIPISAAELAAIFDWQKLRGDAIYLDSASL